jgi:plastocyanin
MRMIRSVMVGAAVAVAGACSDATGGSDCTPTATQVCMTAATFNPVSFTVSAGTTVTWRDGSGIAHTVTSDAGSPEAFNQSTAPSGSFSRQFSNAGTFNYHCTLHGSAGTGMHGTITVN